MYSWFKAFPFSYASASRSSFISETFIALANTSFVENGKPILYNVRLSH